MLFSQNPFRQCMVIVLIKNWNRRLQNNGPSVEVFVHKMNRTTSELHTVFERLFLRFKAGKGRKERWMNIDDTLRKCGDKIRGEQSHISSETNQIYPVFLENRHNLSVVFFALQPLGSNGSCRNAKSFCALQPDGIRLIANHNGDFSIGDSPRGHTIRQRLKIRAAAT